MSLGDVLARHARQHSVPGAALGIIRGGQVTTAYHGVADVTTGEPVTAESRFSFGSLTKSMVATAIARLPLSFGDSVSMHVPELRDARWAQRATVRDLLANRSRLPLSVATEFGFDARSDQPISRLAADLAGGPTADFWSYSNAGWCLLGRVMETVTGSTWDDAMRRALLEPIGVSAGEGPRVSGHELTPQGPSPVPPLVSCAYAPAGAGLTGTLTDLVAFAALHLEDASLAFLRTVQAKVAIHGWLDSWCLGWAWFDWPGAPVWGWDGLVNGERSILRLLPEQRSAIALLTNCDSGRAMYRSLFTELVGMPPLPLAPSADVGDLSRYEGVYAWPDRQIRVKASEHGLILEDDDGEKVAVPIDERAFLVDAANPDNPTVTFGAFDSAGRPQVLYVMLWGLPRQDP